MGICTSYQNVALRGGLAVLVLAGFFTTGAFAHNVEARYIEPLNWKKAQFAHIYGMGYAKLGHDLDVSHVRLRTLAGRSCAIGNMIAFERRSDPACAPSQ